MADCNKQYNCPPTPCKLDNAIKEYKKSRSGINDPSLKPLLTIIDELRNHIFCQETASNAISSSYSDNALSSSYALTASYVDGNSIVSNHNSLNGLQGGTTDEYYHLTSADYTDLTDGEFTTLHKHESSSYSLTGSFVSFNGDRSITRNDPVWQGVNVGGTNVVQFLNNFFFPFIPATVALSLVPSTTVYEIGNDPSPVIRVNVTANDETLFESGSVRKDGVNTWTITKPVLPSTNYDNTDSNITTGHYYQAYVSASNNGSPGLISSNMSTIYFVYPYFWGTTSTAGLSGTALYNGLTKTIQREDTNQTISFSGTAVYIYYCFPDGQGYSDVSEIYDPNGYKIKSAFTRTIESVTSIGLTPDWTQNYVVYRLTSLSTPNGNYRFVH
jgi:hypothetical protein